MFTKTMIELRIPLKAMGAVRMTQRGKFVNKQAIKYLNYKSAIRISAQSQYKGELIDEPIEVECRFYFAPPKSYTKTKLKQITSKQMLYTKKPDVDNLFKGVTDALNGVIYNDDSQIVKATMYKEYSDEDRIVVEIREVI